MISFQVNKRGASGHCIKSSLNIYMRIIHSRNVNIVMYKTVKESLQIQSWFIHHSEASMNNIYTQIISEDWFGPDVTTYLKKASDCLIWCEAFTFWIMDLSFSEKYANPTPFTCVLFSLSHYWKKRFNSEGHFDNETLPSELLTVLGGVRRTTKAEWIRAQIIRFNGTVRLCALPSAMKTDYFNPVWIQSAKHWHSNLVHQSQLHRTLQDPLEEWTRGCLDWQEPILGDGCSRNYH